MISNLTLLILIFANHSFNLISAQTNYFYFNEEENRLYMKINEPSKNLQIFISYYKDLRSNIDQLYGLLSDCPWYPLLNLEIDMNNFIRVTTVRLKELLDEIRKYEGTRREFDQLINTQMSKLDEYNKEQERLASEIDKALSQSKEIQMQREELVQRVPELLQRLEMLKEVGILLDNPPADIQPQEHFNLNIMTTLMELSTALEQCVEKGTIHLQTENYIEDLDDRRKHREQFKDILFQCRALHDDIDKYVKYYEPLLGKFMPMLRFNLDTVLAKLIVQFEDMWKNMKIKVRKVKELEKVGAYRRQGRKLSDRIDKELEWMKPEF